MAKTKMICTIGPASESIQTLRTLIQCGMNVARLNFSHGSHNEHFQKISTLRKLSHELDSPVAILQDLCGPKIRVGTIPDPGIPLTSGDSFVLTARPGVGDNHCVSVSYANLPQEVRPNDRILLADGLMELVVERISGLEIHTRVVTGGTLTSHKGINVPTGSLNLPAFTDKDHRDLCFGLEHGVDLVALSFVRSAEDLAPVKALIRKYDQSVPVIAKIEKHEAIDNLDEILAAADGVMVARGDLGVEIPLERVPEIQKQIVKKANLAGKPVIIATQMLRSMVNAPRPTRAEAADVANAVLDGTDAVMLSEETAVGDYPVDALRYLERIAAQAEESFPHALYLRMPPPKRVPESVAHAACVLANHLGAAAVVATTRSGSTAANISRFRPQRPIIAMTPEETTFRRLSLYWGCIPLRMPDLLNTDEMIAQATRLVVDHKFAQPTDTLIITAGHPLWRQGTTNMLRVKIVEEEKGT